MTTWGWNNEFALETPTQKADREWREEQNKQYIAEKTEKERAQEEQRLATKATRQGKTVEQVKAEEEAKAEQKRMQAKYRRYLKEIEALEKELAYKKAFIEQYEKRV